MPRRRDVPVETPKPGESPLRRNPRTRLLNHARDEAGLYDGGLLNLVTVRGTPMRPRLARAASPPRSRAVAFAWQ